jgi:hypothetical protein
MPTKPLKRLRKFKVLSAVTQLKQGVIEKRLTTTLCAKYLAFTSRNETTEAALADLPFRQRRQYSSIQAPTKWLASRA